MIKTLIIACVCVGICCGFCLCAAVERKARKNGKQPDGKLYLDLLDDPPLNMELKIGVGELLERNTILLEVVDLNKGLNDIQEETDV